MQHDWPDGYAGNCDGGALNHTVRGSIGLVEGQPVEVDAETGRVRWRQCDVACPGVDQEPNLRSGNIGFDDEVPPGACSELNGLAVAPPTRRDQLAHHPIANTCEFETITKTEQQQRPDRNPNEDRSQYLAGLESAVQGQAGADQNEYQHPLC